MHNSQATKTENRMEKNKYREQELAGVVQQSIL